MAKFIVTIEETLNRDIVVEAEDMEEAHDMVSEKYYNEEIVLTADDYSCTDFFVSEAIILDKRFESDEDE